MALFFSGKFFTVDGFWSKNPMFLNINTDYLYDGGVRRPNYSIELGMTVTILDESITEITPTLSLIPDDDGNVFIDIAKLVHSVVEKYAEQSYFTDKFSEYASNTFADLDVQISCYERFGNPPEIESGEYTITRRVHWGAVNNEDDSDLWTYVASISGYVDTTPILTNLQQYSLLGFNQTQYLSYYNNLFTGNKNIKPEIKVILNDGTEGLWAPTTNWAPVNTPEMRRSTFTINPAVIGIPNTTAILSIRFIDNDATTPVTDWQNFKIDYEEKECDKLILFANQYCCLETLVAKGRHAQGLELARSVVNTEVTAIQQALYSGTKQRDISIARPHVLRSGYISKAELIAWQECLASNYVYEAIPHVVQGDKYTEFNYSYRAITFNTDKFKVTECGQYLHSFEAEYKYAYPAVTMNEGRQIVDDTSTIPTFTPQETVDSTTYVYLN